MKPKPTKLKNGMPVILVPQKGAESMTVFVLFRVGSRYETKQINGASHFIEHLMFKGTKKRPNTQMISRELDRYGAAYNAYTDKDVTAYYIKMDATHTTLAIDMLHDMLFQSLYDPKEIDRERGVIIEEINMYEDNPQTHVEELLEEALFPNSPLGWNIAGPRDVIKHITREELVRYRDAYYIPERMTIVVAGQIRPGTMSLLEKTFGRVTQHSRTTGPADIPFQPFIVPAKLPRAFAYQEKRTEQAQLALGFYGVPLTHTDQPAATVMATILGGTMSSRLFIEIREKRGLCYSIHASHQAREDSGMFSIFAGLDKRRIKEATRCIYAELERLMRSGVTSEELRRAKDHLRGRTMLAFEDSSTQAEWYGKQWLFLKRVETPDERMAKIERVTGKQVKALAKQIFRKDKMVTSLIGPCGSRGSAERLVKW